jgi:RNA polymerase sigma-70 factor (ECF subfamily)
MPDTVRVLLRQSFINGYADLKARLERRLGSADLADEALQETWLRLEQTSDLAPVANPHAYLYRAALNNATNLRVAEARRLSGAEIDALFDIADDTPNPERVVIAHDEVTVLMRALGELPARQQDIFRQTFRNGAPQATLAAQYNVSVRTIQADLNTAIRHCAKRLGRKSFFASNLPRLSTKQEAP